MSLVAKGINWDYIVGMCKIVCNRHWGEYVMRRFVLHTIFIFVFLLSGCVDVHVYSGDSEDQGEAKHAGIGELVTHDTVLGERGITLEKVQHRSAYSEDGSSQAPFAVIFSVENFSDDEKAHTEMEYRDIIIYSEHGDMGGASPEGGTAIDRKEILEPGEEGTVEIPFPKVEVVDGDEYTLKYSFGMFKKNDIVWEFDESDIEYDD